MNLSVDVKPSSVLPGAYRRFTITNIRGIDEDFFEDPFLIYQILSLDETANKFIDTKYYLNNRIELYLPLNDLVADAPLYMNGTDHSKDDGILCFRIILTNSDEYTKYVKVMIKYAKEKYDLGYGYPIFESEYLRDNEDALKRIFYNPLILDNRTLLHVCTIHENEYYTAIPIEDLKNKVIELHCDESIIPHVIGTKAKNLIRMQDDLNSYNGWCGYKVNNHIRFVTKAFTPKK